MEAEPAELYFDHCLHYITSHNELREGVPYAPSSFSSGHAVQPFHYKSRCFTSAIVTLKLHHHDLLRSTGTTGTDLLSDIIN